MTHKELWLEIAEAFGTPRWERTGEQWNVSVSGLCFALEGMGGEWTGFYHAFKPRTGVIVWWACTLHGDAQRCLFACFMAAMSEEDYNEMVEAV